MNDEITKRIELCENSVTAFQKVKNELSSIYSDEGYSFFEHNFIGIETIQEFYENEKVIQELLQKQLKLSEIISRKTNGLYKEYSILVSLKDKLQKPEFKIVLLLDILGVINTKDMVQEVIEKPNNYMEAEELLQLYQHILDKLSLLAKYRSTFLEEFSLYIGEEEAPSSTKEKNKREIRDNTIKNFYRKYGENMFQPQNMEALRNNLNKVGISIDDISDARMKFIIRRG